MIDNTCTVLVVGGGIAGAGAAITAARAGADTLLVEREMVLGGVAQAGMFRQLCGVYPNGDTRPTSPLNPGVVSELVARTERTPEQVGRVWVQPLGRQDLHCQLSGFATAEPRLRVQYDSTVEAVTVEDGLIREVAVCEGGHREIIAPAVVIDCTGTGAVAMRAGVQTKKASAQKRQLAGYTIHVEGLVTPTQDLSLQVPYACHRGVTEGVLPPLLRLTTFSPGDSDHDGYCKLSVSGEETPDRDQQAETDAQALLDYLSEQLPGFRQVRVAALSPRVIDREGPRIQGLYTLTEDDILAGRKFPDAVVRNAWPMESWTSKRGPVYRYGPDDDHYDIPFRCLRVNGLANLLCAGRCISVTHEAYASTRVMGTCLALGEAAGRAATAFAVDGRYPMENPA